MDNTLKIVNGHLKFKQVSLIEPSANYFILIAAEVDHSIFPFFLYDSKPKEKLIQSAKMWCDTIEKEDHVVSAVVFKAVLIPPGRGKLLKERNIRVPKYDLSILIECKSKQKLKEIVASESYRGLIKDIQSTSKEILVTKASNIRRINPVNHVKQGVFLFNYFYADDVQLNLAVWNYTAGWFQQETGLDNSTVLLPLDPKSSPHAIINHCRWDGLGDILPSLLFKKSFRSYVLDNFYANQVAAVPVLYKMA